MDNHERRIALITGGSRGLGRSMVAHLAARGVDVILTYRSREDEAADAVREAEAAGARAVALRLDVSEPAGFGAFVDALRVALEGRFARTDLDYLVNNAGTGAYAPFAETTEAQLDALIAIHLKGPFLLTQRLLPLLRDGGRVLNVSSGLARFTLPGYAAYAAVKGAVEVLTRYQARELGERGIRVNVLAPGAIETDFGGGVVRDDPRVNALIASQTALGRVGLPDDVGPAVAALLSPDAAWITGQRVEVSGGQSL